MARHHVYHVRFVIAWRQCGVCAADAPWPSAIRTARGIARSFAAHCAVAVAAASLLALSDAAARADEGAVDTAVVFVIDNSSSMSNREMRVAREAHAEAIQSSEVLDAIANGPTGRSAFAVVDFARTARLSIDWTIVDSPQSARRLAAQLRQLERLRGATGISAGLLLSSSLLEGIPWTPTRRVVNVIGDGGENVDRELLVEVRRRLIEDGVTINGIPIMIAPDISDIRGFDDLDAYFAAMVIGGPGAFSLPLTEIDEMATKLRQKLAMELY